MISRKALFSKVDVAYAIENTWTVLVIAHSWLLVGKWNNLIVSMVNLKLNKQAKECKIGVSEWITKLLEWYES